MGEPRFVTPELRLTKLMEEPGGLTVAEALADAAANLESIRPTCLAEMTAVLAKAQARFGQMGDAPDPTAVAELYGLAVGAIGGGEVSATPGVDEALKSLSDLIDALRGRAAFDRAAVAVHLQAWRLLMTAAPDEAARGEIFVGFNPEREGSWIAERDGQNIGCVFLQDAGDNVAKLRLLLVEPAARGLGLGRRLVDECVGFARQVGYGEITLWTQSILTAARAIYGAVGFELVDSWPNRDFGGLGLTSEKWRLKL